MVKGSAGTLGGGTTCTNIEMDPDSRRRFLVAGAATAGVAWAAPAVLRVDRAAAAPGSCIPFTVPWSGVSRVGSTWTATATSGDLTVTASIAARLARRATGTVAVVGSDLVVQMSGQAIGDDFVVSLAFAATSGTILEASTTIVDVDQNGRGLGCATTSRFRDEITSLSGPGLSLTPSGSVVEGPPGTWATALVCKTNDTETLGLSWSAASGVTAGGFRWVAGTPPGTGGGGLDLQLIKLTPVVMCAQGVAPAAGAPATLRAATATIVGD